MAKLLLKTPVIRFLLLLNLAIGMVLAIPFIFSINFLPKITFAYSGELYELILLLALTAPSLFFLLTSAGLFIFSSLFLVIAFVFSVVSIIWYFAFSLILFYMRFTFSGKCGFEGYLPRVDAEFDPCSGKVIPMSEITVFLIISLILFFVLWFTIISILRVREENKLLAKQEKRD